METCQCDLCLVNPGRHCIAAAMGRPAYNRTAVAFSCGLLGERAIRKHRHKKDVEPVPRTGRNLGQPACSKKIFVSISKTIQALFAFE